MMDRSFIRIATWNVDRPTQNSTKNAPAILEMLRKIDADIWILTETNATIVPESTHANPFHGYVGLASRPESSKLPGQNKTTIWSRFGIRKSIQTFDPDTAVCAEIETRIGLMIVYGTIITYWGDIYEEFQKPWDRHFDEIDRHAKDWEKISRQFPHHIMCLAGDFNQNRDGTLWFKQQWKKNSEAVQELSNRLSSLSIKCVTEQDMRKEKRIPRANIDHICVSERIIAKPLSYDAWFINESSHNGVYVDIPLRS